MDLYELYTVKFTEETKIGMIYAIYKLENEEITEMEQEFINYFVIGLFKKLLENKDKHCQNLNT
ncbi:hypothetical protein JZO73_08145 [Enterococcus plantarum]|uniref:hypothetical protein n=1 Tax=Enterococcus plantarum TaxID=1077675 RepID=UPI001A90C477|nr:hypothetical protein [Enterococcus plantarum]MBO0467507.1 hypothetical protein [Enterococcus plantarum]